MKTVKDLLHFAASSFQMSGVISTTTNESTLCGTLCYLDFDVDNSLSKRSLTAHFVASTSLRYGLTSNSINDLGGSEIKRLRGYFSADYEFNSRGEIEPEPMRTNVRIVVKLHTEECPLACENFVKLCEGNDGKVGESGKSQTYESCNVHRVQSDFVLQSGDFVFGNGTGGESVYGKKFKDERPGLSKKHDRAGVLSMGNR